MVAGSLAISALASLNAGATVTGVTTLNGATTVSGVTNLNGDVTGNKFTIAGSSGNTAFAGTLTVPQITTAAGTTLTVAPTSAGIILEPSDSVSLQAL